MPFRCIILKWGRITWVMNGYLYDATGNPVEAIPVQDETILWVNRLKGCIVTGFPLPIEGDIRWKEFLIYRLLCGIPILLLDVLKAVRMNSPIQCMQPGRNSTLLTEDTEQTFPYKNRK
jgi:hypothetical protein